MSKVNLLGLRRQADIRSPEMLLERALPLIVAEEATIARVIVYRLTRNGMVVWHGENSIHEIGAFIPLEANSHHQRAILQQQAVVTDNNLTLIAPLIYGKEIFALVEFVSHTETEQDMTLAIADDLSLLLYNTLTDNLLRQQLALTGKLTVSSSFRDIATVIGNTILHAGQFVSITQFTYDEDALVGGIVVATANRQDGFSRDIPIEIGINEVQLLHQTLMEQGELLISDTQSDKRLAEASQQWFHKQHIRAIYVLPLWIHNHLDAIITLSDTSRTLAPSDLEKELLHNIAHQASIIIEKQQLLEQSQKSVEQSTEQARVLRLINDLMTTTTSNSSDHVLFQQTANVLLEITGADHIGIVMRDENNVAKLVSEAPSTDSIGVVIDVGEGSLHPLMKEAKQPVIITDLAKNKEISKAHRDALLGIGVKSLMVLPMFDENDNLIGSVGLDYYTLQDRIEIHTVEAAQAVVSQITLGLQKDRLLAESQRKAEQLEHLTEFGQQLRAYLSIEEILGTTLNYAPTTIDADYVGILLYDRPTNTIRNTATKFQDDLKIDLDAKSITEENNSIALQAWTSHDIIQVHDLHSDWEWKHDLHRELQSIVAIPLTQAGITLGILEAGGIHPNQFNSQDVTTLRQVSNQLAIALSNASAYSQSQRLARNKSQANEIIALLQQQLDVSDVLNVTANELGKALGAKKARIRLGTPPPDMLGAK